MGYVYKEKLCSIVLNFWIESKGDSCEVKVEESIHLESPTTPTTPTTMVAEEDREETEEDNDEKYVPPERPQTPIPCTPLPNEREPTIVIGRPILFYPRRTEWWFLQIERLGC